MNEIKQRISKWIDINILHDLINNVKNEYIKTVNVGTSDIFKTIFDKEMYKLNTIEYRKFEHDRIKDKVLNNKIGYFHEKVLQNCNGWKEYYDYSMDMCNKSENVFIQIKNKYNTLNSSSMKYLKNQMIKLNNDKPNSTIILGIVNDKISVNKVFIPHYDNILKISGKNLYHYITTDINSFDDLTIYLQYYLKRNL